MGDGVDQEAEAVVEVEVDSGVAGEVAEEAFKLFEIVHFLMKWIRRA